MTLLDRMQSLADCLCTQISEDGSPETCYCGIIPGDMAIIDFAGNCGNACGMAWVRMASLQPMQGVGIPYESVGNCGAELGSTLELGIMRCFGVPSRLPQASEYAGAVEQQMKDAYTMRKAVVCCSSFSSKDFSLGAYTPSGPQGGYLGGTWQITVI